MGVLAVSGSGLLVGNVIEMSAGVRSLQVEWNDDRTQFRVKVADVYYGWFAHTRSNKKVVLVLLRQMYDSRTGRRLFTEEELGVLLGSTNRQAVDGHMKGFRDAEGDFGKYLSRTRKVDAAVVELVWKTLLAIPYVSLSELTAEVNLVYTGAKPLSSMNVRKALEEISGYRIWRLMLKGVEKGRAHYDEAFLIEHVLRLLSERTPDNSEISPLPEGCDVSELSASPVEGETQDSTLTMSKRVIGQLENFFSPSDASQIGTQISGAWEGASGLMLLAFVLYSSGLSYAVIGGWLGVDASTICRWMVPLSAYGWSWLRQQQLTFSGQVAVDEKHIKIGGVTWYLFVAVDCITRCPLHIAFYPSNAEPYCRTFLLELKAKGYSPYVIVTDGWDAYIKAIARAFPHAQHALCRFHLIRSVFRRMKTITFFDASVCKVLKTLFHTDDPRTVRRRIASLKETLSSLKKPWVIEGLLEKLEQVMPAVGNPQRWPSTSNAAEWFFRDYERLVYLSKGPFAGIESAQKLTGLFVLGYVFRMGLKGQACPLERAQVDVSRIPLYHLINRPKLSKLQELIADQYTDAFVSEAAQKQA